MTDEKETSFKVSDRRKFNADGSPKDPPPEEPKAAAADLPKAEPQPDEEPGTDNILSFPGDTAKKKEAEPTVEPAGKPSARQSANAGAAQAYGDVNTSRDSRLPPASFLGLANMLGVEAAMHLGLIDGGPDAGDRNIDLDAARHVIDLLGILQEKTRGNLTPEEDSLLDNMLADLRMQFVVSSRRR